MKYQDNANRTYGYIIEKTNRILNYSFTYIDTGAMLEEIVSMKGSLLELYENDDRAHISKEEFSKANRLLKLAKWRVLDYIYAYLVMDMESKSATAQEIIDALSAMNLIMHTDYSYFLSFSSIEEGIHHAERLRYLQLTKEEYGKLLNEEKMCEKLLNE